MAGCVVEEEREEVEENKEKDEEKKEKDGKKNDGEMKDEKKKYGKMEDGKENENHVSTVPSRQTLLSEEEVEKLKKRGFKEHTFSEIKTCLKVELSLNRFSIFTLFLKVLPSLEKYVQVSVFLS